MRTSLRVLTILAAGAAALSGATPPRSKALAFPIEGAIQNPANGHWYKFVCSWNTTWQPYTWKFAKEAAEAVGGHLATIDSREEDDFVYYNVHVKWTSSYWLGGSDEFGLGQWTWVTGETWNYANWWNPPGAGSPPHYVLGGNNPAALVPIWLHPDAARTEYGYVIEWDTDPTPLPPPDAPPSLLTASVDYGGAVSLRWTDTTTTEEAFEIERRTDATGFSHVADTGPNETTFADITVAPTTRYTYRVRARNSAGVSEWSNEASAIASPLAPAPVAPSDLTVLSSTRDTVELWWLDRSAGETGFEVFRRKGTGEFQFHRTLPSDSFTFTDTDLAPDADYEYAVRAYNSDRASFFCQAVSATTLPTLSVTPTRADIKDSPKFGKDSLKVQALFDFLPESPDGLFDVLAEGIGLRVGPVDRPVVMNLPKNLDTWKVKGTKATWKSPKGSTPKYCIQVDTEKRTVKATASGLEFPEPPVNPMRVSITVGDDGGSAKGDWETKKPGVFRLR